MRERASPSALRREALGGHADDGVEARSRQVPIRPGAPDQRVELVLAIIAARRLGDDLLRQHVERRVVRDDAIEPAATDNAQERRALDQIVAREGEQASLRRAGHRVAGAPEPLKQRRNPVRRADLADEIDRADVDAELERRRRDERFESTALQPRLGVEPSLLRQAPVMSGDGVLAQPIAEVPRRALRHAPRVDEHERGAMTADQGGQPIVVLLPDLV